VAHAPSIPFEKGVWSNKKESAHSYLPILGPYGFIQEETSTRILRDQEGQVMTNIVSWHQHDNG